jgi:hypothetical protein
LEPLSFAQRIIGVYVKRIFFALVSMLSLFTAFAIPVLPAHADTKVSVFNYPGLTEADLACRDEVDNLKEIITDIGGYTIDLTITSLGTGLLTNLNASKFFFVPDMERAFTVSNASDFPASAVTDFRTWLNNGGVLVMTGTSGTKDVDFLNKITDWGLSSASGLNGATRVDSNASGTPFGEASLDGTTLGVPSATDAINKGSAPSSSDFKAMWGTDSQAPVAVMSYGSGRIIYLGFDYFNAGRAGAGGTVCGANSDAWVQKIVPAALRYATELAEAAEEARSSSSTSTPASPKLPVINAFANGSAIVTPGQNLVLDGSRLHCTTYVQINGQPVVFNFATIAGGFSQLTIGVPAGLAPGSHSLTMDTCAGPVTYDKMLVVPKQPAVFEAVTRNGLERGLELAKLTSFVLINRLDYNHVECIVNSSVPSFRTVAREALNSFCKTAQGLLSTSVGSTSELRTTHKPASVWIRITLSKK